MKHAENLCNYNVTFLVSIIMYETSMQLICQPVVKYLHFEVTVLFT